MRTAVDEIKERLPITDVLRSYITLESAGSQFKAKCPFHNERTASFYVTPERGLYYCFGCGAKGDIFSFVQEFEGVDFNGALHILAERAGVQITRDAFKRDESAPLYDALEEAATLYHEALKTNKEVIMYLEGRGVTKKTIEQFRIGYAPESWDFLARHFGGIRADFAERTGLTKMGDHGPYDRFRSRIMFPICDSSGRVVGFSGRSFPESDDAPKYLNTQETSLFQKSKLLFGFDQAKFDIKKKNFAILVEGQFDLVLSHQVGFTNTIATSGTALSEESTEGVSNLATLARLTKNIILAYDGDEAGKKAMDRAARIALSMGMNPKVAVLPEKSDPADYIHANGADAWKEQLRASEHVVVFQVKDILAKKLSPHAFTATLRERVFPYVWLLPSAIERARQLELVSATTGLPLSALGEDFNQFVDAQPKEKQFLKTVPERHQEKKQFDTPTLFLGLLSWQTGLAEPAIDALAYRDRTNAIAFDAHTYALPELDDETLHAVRTYAAAFYSALATEELEAFLEEQLQSMLAVFLRQLRSKHTAELAQAERAGDEQKVSDILGVLHRLSMRLQEVTDK